MNRIINMVMRQLLNKAVMKSMNAGVARMSGPQKGQQSSKEQNEAVKRTRQSMKVLRRVSRF